MANTNGNRPAENKVGQMGDDMDQALKDLHECKIAFEKADDLKARLLLEKLGADDAKNKAQKEMVACVDKQKERQKEYTQSMDAVKDDILKLEVRRQNLLEKFKRCQAELEAQRAETAILKQKFKINVEIPDTAVRFSGQTKDDSNDNTPIRGLFIISQRPSVLLQKGQALIMFEEERVASQILKIANCTVSCDDVSLKVRPKKIRMDPAVKFEVHLDVSRKDVMVSHIPASMPEDRMRDRLEMSFSRPSKGGGEVAHVSYDKNAGTGQITFLQRGVAEKLVLRSTYCVFLDSEVNVQVGPIYRCQLCKFQTFCGSPNRTILLDDIEDKGKEDVQDHLEIHFQKPSNYGGEIERIKYVSEDKALQAFFVCEDTAEMAEN